MCKIINKDDISNEKLEKMSKEQLIDTIKKIRDNQRALTYEDRMKLEIIDNSMNLAVWACDENYVIKLWEADAEKIYQYKKEDLIDKKLSRPLPFISNEEIKQALDDYPKCIKDNNDGKGFPNCDAGDNQNHNGKLRIITNTFRVYDKDNKTFLAAEIGLDLTKLKEQDAVYKKSLKNQEQKQQLKSDAENLEFYFNENKNEFDKFLNGKESEAIKLSKRAEFIQGKNKVLESIKNDWLITDIEDIKQQIDDKHKEEDLNKIQNKTLHQLRQKIEKYFNDFKLEIEEVFSNLTDKKQPLSAESPKGAVQAGVNVSVVVTNNNSNNNTVFTISQEQQLKGKLEEKGITAEQVDELIQILKEEKQDAENRTLGKNATKWCEQFKTIGLNVLSNIIFTAMYGLPPFQ